MSRRSSHLLRHFIIHVGTPSNYMYHSSDVIVPWNRSRTKNGIMGISKWMCITHGACLVTGHCTTFISQDTSKIDPVLVILHKQTLPIQAGDARYFIHGTDLGLLLKLDFAPILKQQPE